MPATEISYAVDATGYTVTVGGGHGCTLEEIRCGNHPGESTMHALDRATLFRFARQTAGDVAAQYGFDPALIEDWSD